jgi:tetratricopeptide (TPR) repeat protein
MKVPFQLRKAAVPYETAGWLLLTEDTGPLLEVCADCAPLPPIFAVSGGFLVVGRVVRNDRHAGLSCGAVRLRRLADNLFLPVDAELIPPLLDDEAAGLARDRGLVFLPGGQVLGFIPGRPLRASDLVSCRRLPPRGWRPLPERPHRPERLQQILLDMPGENPETILEAGAGDIGSEAPRPPDATPGAQIAGRAAVRAGRGLMWLGQHLGLQGLARLGAGLVRRAVERVPRLSEALLGRQEAALRELLRKFREGNLDEALRRALPLGSPGDRGVEPGGDRLPWNNLIFNLREVLDSGRGSAELWLGSAQVHAELTREYRKAAEDATRRGDWRRAAFIYGKLLRDYRAAAAVLERGGLYREAAILYLEKLSDATAAARAFEAAGEIDRALQLYRQRGEHVAAGDLLRRAGEEELALEEYRVAAAHLAAADNHLAAGDLLRDRGRRPDLALEFFAAGWARRPAASALGCLLRLMEVHADDPQPRKLLALADEADAFFAPPGNDAAAGTFYNALAGCAGREHLSAVRDDLRDRALVGLAGKLRQRAAEETRPGNTVSTLLGQTGLWSAEVVNDAGFAFKVALPRTSPPRTPDAPRVRLRVGEVTAACRAAGTGAVFVGFADGMWAAYDPRTGQASFYTLNIRNILALAADGPGRCVAVLQGAAPGHGVLASYTSTDGSFLLRSRMPVAGLSAAPWLTPIATQEGHSVLGLWDGRRLAALWADALLSTGEIEGIEDLGLEPQTALLLAPDAAGRPSLGFILCTDGLYGFAPGVALRKLPNLGWSLNPPGMGQGSPSLSCLKSEGSLQLAGLGGDARAYWAALPLPHREPSGSGARAASVKTGYVAVALVGSGRLAAVRPDGIDWLHRERGGLVPWVRTLVDLPPVPVDLPPVVGCFHSPLTAELLVVCRDGWLVRVPVPH